jgi:hypothetical protein
MTDLELREVYSASNAQEAYLVSGVLEQAGIVSRVVGDELQNALELAAGAMNPRVWVRSEDFERAQAIIAELEQDRTSPDAPGWTCPQCGERNEAEFDVCWKCQQERPTAT